MQEDIYNYILNCEACACFSSTYTKVHLGSMILCSSHIKQASGLQWEQTVLNIIVESDNRRQRWRLIGRINKAMSWMESILTAKKSKSHRQRPQCNRSRDLEVTRRQELKEGQHQPKEALYAPLSMCQPCF